MQSLLKSRVADLLSAEVGKHDYDWLLTPDTPHFSGGNDGHTSKATPKIKADARSVSTGKASRLSASQPEKDNPAKKLTRSSSTSRSSLPATHSSSTYFSNSSQTAALNTSTASVTSKPSPTASRFTVRSDPRPPTPTRTRPAATASNAEKPVSAPLQSSRPCTPTARSRTPSASSSYAGSNVVAGSVRPNSRPSTPARRTTAVASAPALTRSTSVGHSPSTNSRIVDSCLTPRPSSPLPRGKAQAHAPTNSRTKIQEIDASALSPVVSRGRLQEKSSNARSNSKLNEAKVGEKKKPTTTGNTASERLVSKIKPAADHTPKDKEKKQGGNHRPLSLFPHSFRSTVNGGKPARRFSQDKADHHISIGVPAAVASDDDGSIN